ncbi:MAG TPA: hypothetical protein DDZ88_16535 [Verrucomicrobiales bacterium]|nr:hypothetical protein [Verrucomicrobiales bacterium]
MGSDWKTYSLGELGPIKTGKTPPSSLGDGFGGTVPFVTPGDMNGQKWITDTDRYLNENGLSAVSSSLMPARSVAVSCIGSDMGKAALLSKPSVTNQQINTIAVDESKFNAEFVYYDLSVRQQELKAAASGSATPILNKGHFSAFEMLVPPRATQDKIAEILGRLDDKIDINHRINQTLEQMAQAIFKSWFVDFDPVKAKIAAKHEGRDPLRAAMSAISGKTDAGLDQLPPEQYQQLAATAALFPDEMVDSELGEIPKGWRASQIGGEVIATGGGTPSTQVSEYWDNGTYYWATPRDFSNLSDKVLLATERKITKEGLSKISSGLLPAGTVLMSSRAPVGYLAITKIPTAVNQGFIAMKCNKDLSPEFCLQWTHQMMDDIKQRASGTTFAEISKSNFRQIPVVVPSKGVMDSYTITVSGLYELIASNVAESTTLSETRDSLLPKLLSGEMSIGGDMNG